MSLSPIAAAWEGDQGTSWLCRPLPQVLPPGLGGRGLGRVTLVDVSPALLPWRIWAPSWRWPPPGPPCLGQTGSPQPTFSKTGKCWVLAFFTTEARLSSFSSGGLNAATATIIMRSRVPSAYMSILTEQRELAIREKPLGEGFLDPLLFFFWCD